MGFQPTNVAKLQAMQFAIVNDKHDVDDTLQLAITHKELACIVSGLLLVDMIMPEFEPVTDEIVSKLKELTDYQDFFSTRMGIDLNDPDDTGGV